MNTASQVEIDDSLYSRQRYVLGDVAMQRMAGSNILLCGLGGLGVEIAKNIILAGVKSLTLQDSKSASYSDLGSQFYLTESDVKNGVNRAEACFKKLAELNPYVTVNINKDCLTSKSDMNFLKAYQCIILTECALDVQLQVNEFCRQQEPQIKFICGDVYGVFCWTFCDFGEKFEVHDPNGEESREVLIGQVTKSNPGEVTTLDNKMHGLEDGDVISFKEVQGMDVLNEKSFNVKVKSPYVVTICDTSGPVFQPYITGGIMKKEVIPKIFNFESLTTQLYKPSLMTADLSKFHVPLNIHLGMLALHSFQQQHYKLPNIRCKQDSTLLLNIAKELNVKMKIEEINEDLLKNLAVTSQGCLAPLCAFLGGVMAQEGLKAVTGKFTPLNQWLHLDACELLDGSEVESEELFQPIQDRGDALRICLGQPLCSKLKSLNLFMVGCGAIGCEMLKNYAVLGVGSNHNHGGKITITDNDLIEKSNLNRQFLFRPEHIRKPKSTTAANSTLEINPTLCIEPHQNKVGPDTEKSIYHDEFFLRQDIIVNALDNVEARRYMDSRCVTNQKPLLESGTMGTKGHVQVIVPFVTESYASQRDPVDEDVPYCTLKSFPSNIEHCIQWARDKFESTFCHKPAHFTKFWANYPVSSVIETLKESGNIEGAIQVSKIAANRPHTWEECVTFGTMKFHKYFCNRAKQLLHAFPLDTRLQNGNMFWQSPKRPPVPQKYDPENDIHVGFVKACAKLIADTSGVKYTESDLDNRNISKLSSSVDLPSFRPSSKKIETDESATKRAEKDEEISGDDLVQSARRLTQAIQKYTQQKAISTMHPLCFEKDDDSNGHIDFITTAANMRAAMYGIEPSDRLKTKRIAGRIVPAIATTTAAVAGLVTIELIKTVKKMKIESFKNTFLNLALPVILLSEPGAVDKQTMSNGMTYSLWDRWEVTGRDDLTIAQFIQIMKEKYNVVATMIVQGVKSVYLPIMPGHKKRLPQPIAKFLKRAPSQKYTDLVVSYSGTDPKADDEMGPPVRYYFN